ncbi:hypothetical protein NFI96_002743 [Prochilodus magdalenae]|nr:hypothetical protein NFI96_002743 [Prochilodus magdalenae]
MRKRESKPQIHCHAALPRQAERFEQTLSAVRSEVKEFKETLGSLTEAVSAHDARLDSLESALKKMEGVNTALQQKIEDLEGRSRRNNIRIIGVPEGAEGKRPTDFVAELLPKLLGEENFNLPLVVDRAHRSLQPRPADGARPRPIIARIHLFQVKEKIMQLRRLHGPPQFRSNKLNFDPITVICGYSTSLDPLPYRLQQVVMAGMVVAKKLILLEWKMPNAPSFKRWLSEMLIFASVEHLRSLGQGAQDLNKTWKPLLDYFKGQ